MGKLTRGTNDLLTVDPILSKEWNFEKNYPLTPSDISYGSHKRVWWNCTHNHNWLSSPHNRRNGNGCPYCSGRLPINGETDLASRFPEIAKEWNFERNGTVTPKDVTYGSSKKYWWICSKGHEWQTSVCHRTSGEKCPICMTEIRTSFPEQAIFFYCKRMFPDAINQYKPKWLIGDKKGQSEIDIYLPKLKVGIEYDGQEFHKDEDRDLKKDRILFERDIQLYRIREPNCPELRSTSICIYIESLTGIFYYETAIKELFELIKSKYELSGSVDINIKRDYTKILNSYEHINKSNSIATINPELLSEWNYEKNGKIKPEAISYGSQRLIWWKCSKCQHVWQDTPKHRNAGRGCPNCALKKRITTRISNKINQGDSLLNWCIQNSEWGEVLLSEWNNKNQFEPNSITFGSTKKALWKCENGHEWSAVISNRVRGAKCPYCTNKKTLTGYNDLATLRPDLMEEWIYEKNTTDPSKVRLGSNEKVWWRCGSCEGEWQAVIYNRTKENGSGCPYCAGRKVKIGFNDLNTTNPELSKEWDKQKNTFTPSDVTSGTEKKAWWICQNCGFKWYASIGDRAKGHGCPRCARRKAARSKRRKC